MFRPWKWPTPPRCHNWKKERKNFQSRRYFQMPSLSHKVSHAIGQKRQTEIELWPNTAKQKPRSNKDSLATSPTKMFHFSDGKFSVTNKLMSWISAWKEQSRLWGLRPPPEVKIVITEAFVARVFVRNFCDEFEFVQLSFCVCVRGAGIVFSDKSDDDGGNVTHLGRSGSGPLNLHSVSLTCRRCRCLPRPAARRPGPPEPWARRTGPRNPASCDSACPAPTAECSPPATHNTSSLYNETKL